jgi:hypothetical protein
LERAQRHPRRRSGVARLDGQVAVVDSRPFGGTCALRGCDPYHLLLDEQAAQIFVMTDDIAERARKIGGDSVRSISDISKHQRLKDNNRESIRPEHMLAELWTIRPSGARGFCQKRYAIIDRERVKWQILRVRILAREAVARLRQQ